MSSKHLHDYYQGPCSCWVLPTARRSTPGADGRYATNADGSSVLPRPRKERTKVKLQGAAQDEKSQQLLHSLGTYLASCGGTRHMANPDPDPNPNPDPDH